MGGLLLAQTCAASICESKETIIFFGNGIKTLKKNAFDAKTKIKEKLQEELPPEEFDRIGFDIAYNDTHGLPLDLLESTIQLLTGNVSRFWRFFWALEPVPDWFADKMILLAAAVDKSALVTTDSLKEHVVTYRNRIAEGKKVLLVAHSQGNMFGNQAYSLLNSREQQSFAMVAVANVDSNVLGMDSPYTTLEDDMVVAALIAAQIALPSRPMAPNTVNLLQSDDTLGHYFIQSYMAEGSTSELKITKQIITSLGELVSPSPLVDSGVITVSLTWGSATDVDLHIYEPNGTHVYWENFEGTSGSLDRDDRSGYGPEHYHVPTCANLERGVYHVALDYFEGGEPTAATIQIEAGLLVRTYEISMPSEIYGSVDYPELIANIWVKSGDNGGYEFEIY